MQVKRCFWTFKIKVATAADADELDAEPSQFLLALTHRERLALSHTKRNSKGFLKAIKIMKNMIMWAWQTTIFLAFTKINEKDKITYRLLQCVIPMLVKLIFSR